MPWTKTSDRLAHHPKILGIAAVPGADERLVDELTGFLTRCASVSSAHLTDYLITEPVALAVSPTRAPELLRAGVAAGLLVPRGRGRSRSWVIIQDDDLWHIRASQDIARERRRNQDRRRPELTMPVLARDGDECRYCGVVVKWRDHRSARGGTFDHLDPESAATVDTYVVACLSCNSSLKDVPIAARAGRLLPPPDAPYFSPQNDSLALLREYFGRDVPRSEKPHGDTAADGPATSAHRRKHRSRPAASAEATDHSPAPAPSTRPHRDTAADGPATPTAWDTAAAAATPAWALPDQVDTAADGPATHLERDNAAAAATPPQRPGKAAPTPTVGGLPGRDPPQTARANSANRPPKSPSEIAKQAKAQVTAPRTKVIPPRSQGGSPGRVGSGNRVGSGQGQVGSRHPVASPPSHPVPAADPHPKPNPQPKRRRGRRSKS